jgi:cell volume regulation protein A
MDSTRHYALVLLLLAAAGLAAVLSNQLSARIRIPAPVLFLVAAAIAEAAVPPLHPPGEKDLERIVTVALVLILFDGGLHIGWRRFREAVAPIALTGVVGTILTAGALAVLAHLAFGFSWYVSLLLATALSPTDPAVVFSVLGRREIEGRSGTVLEGESGANDPVGIALLMSLLSAGHLSAGTFADVLGQFSLQMAVGLAVGAVGGRLLLQFVRRVSLPSEALHPVATLSGAVGIYGVATVAHGSGFLAVLVAGIAVGDERAPFKREIVRFHQAMAGLAEIVAFLVLGLTVDLHVVSRADVWGPGLALGALLAFVIRPLLVGPLLLRSGLRRGELAFVVLSGLKGAVPILLGVLIAGRAVPGSARLYGIVIVVVTFSVAVQGSLVPWAAQMLGVPMRPTSPQPYTLGVRLEREPEGVLRLVVGAGSEVEGSTVDEVADRHGDVWVSLLVREGNLVPVRGRTRLKTGDEVVISAGDALHREVTAAFSGPLSH